jgi:hypothetical protein
MAANSSGGDSSWFADGGREYVDGNPHISYPYLIIIGVASIVGTAGNFAVFGAILLNRNLQRPKAVFMVNLALADLWVTAVGDVISIFGQ